MKLIPVKIDTVDKDDAMRTSSHDADALKSSRNKLKALAQEEETKEEVKLPDIFDKNQRNVPLNIQDTNEP